MRKGLLAGAFSLLLWAFPMSGQRTFAPRSGGMQFRGIPGSVTSPRPDGSLRGIPGSVTDPRATNGLRMHGSFNFGNWRGDGFHHHHFTPVLATPYYAYPYYPLFYDYSAYYQQPEPAPAPQPQVIIIKDETSHSDDSSRYGEHSFNERGHEPAHEEAAPPKPASAPELEDPGPMTTLVYRDGHKSEIRNYAIVGPNLLDLTKAPVIKKIPLDSLDLEATRRENEENGVDFHLP
ncbi:MAG TPA: hypothetical protein VG498_17595 [Terriglobales bacterium]|nr:hypothetical protein [Terriglobales bacterium]